MIRLNLDDFYLPNEVLELLGIAPSTLWKWRNDGRIPYKRLPNGRPVYPKKAVNKILEDLGFSPKDG